MGLKSQFGFAEETIFGTRVAPSRFLPIVSEGVVFDIVPVKSGAHRAAQRIMRDDGVRLGRKSAAGPVVLEMTETGLGLVVKHMVGAIATTQPDVGLSPTVFDHTGTLGDLRGKSLTAQFGRDKRDNNVEAFEYPGAKIASWSIECAVDEVGKITLNLVAQDESTAQALGSATYSVGDVLTFVEGDLTIGGTATELKSARLDGDNGIAVDDFALGSQLRREPVESARREISGEFDADFVDLVAYNRFVNKTIAQIILKFEGDIIEDAFKFTFQVTANARFTGRTPTASSLDEIRQGLPFEVLAPAGGGQAISVLYRTSDATP